MLLPPVHNLLTKFINDFVIFDGPCMGCIDLAEDEVVEPFHLILRDRLTREEEARVLVLGIHVTFYIIRE